jgi:superfamily II DNA helicase RecQ
MATHCREQHSWKKYACKGRPTDTTRRLTERTIPDPWRQTACQRLFPSRHGSSFFAVNIAATDVEANNVAEASNNNFLAFMHGGLVARNEKERATNTHIDSQNVFETDPWVERAGWHNYLDTCEVESLLALIDKPNPDNESVLAAIWNAMAELYQTCNETMASKAGIFIRMEAIRDQMHQQRYRPLQSYQGKKPSNDYCRPWQMVLMFFGRTWPLVDGVSPRYALNNRQERAWSALLLTAEGGADTPTTLCEGDTLSPLAEACLVFCLSLLDQRVRSTEYESPLVYALALQSITAAGWRECGRYTKILSAVIKLSQFMVVQAAMIADADAIRCNAHQAAPEGRCLESVTEIMDKFMVRGTKGPMQWMLDLRTYGLKVHFETTSEGEVEWIDDELLYKAIRFTMPEFRSFVHGLVNDVERLVYQDLLFDERRTNTPPVRIEALQDDPSNSVPGWNFLQDPRNKHIFHTQDWLINHIALDKQRQAMFKLQGLEGRPNKSGIKTYLDQVKVLLHKLLVLIHVVGGQPARGTEILSIRHSNTVAGKHRNIFIIHGMVAFVPRYSKCSRHAGRSKVIHRFVPSEVGRLVVLYLWLILPFQRALEQMLQPENTISHEMWPPDVQGTKWNSDRFTHALQQETEAGLGCRLNIQTYRQVVIAIGRKYLKTQSAFTEDDDDSSSEKDELGSLDTIYEEQAGHTARIGETVYARLIGELTGTTASKRQRFQRLSIEWHAFLAFLPPSTVNTSSRPRKHVMPMDLTGNAKRIRWRGLRTVNATTQLRAIYGEQAEFRGAQQVGIHTILRGESPVVIVMPTGGGKSLMFILPAACDNAGLTIVVVPLLSLRQDLLRRCELAGLQVAAWDGRSPADAASIVFITPEAVEEDAFQTFMNRMRVTGRLARIVIDECHTVLDGSSKFRAPLQRLGRLAAMRTQMVLLTATLPPTEEQRLWRKMHFAAESVKLIRAPTTRRNIRYAIIDMDKEPVQSPAMTAVDRAAQVIGRYITGLPEPRGKVIVYCHEIGITDRLSKSLDCAAYHSKVINREDVLERFISSDDETIAATSSLSMGVDVPGVDAVLHVGAPRSLVDYAQESGRAGRDGRASQAVIFLGNLVDAPADRDQGRRAALLEYVQREADIKTCRRVVLDKYMDGEMDGVPVRNSCTDGEEPCDVCAAERLDGQELDMPVLSDADEAEFAMQEARMSVQRSKVTASVRAEQLTLEQLRHCLIWWTTHCPICMVQGSEALHDMRTCTAPMAGAVRDSARRLRSMLHFAKFSGCYYCMVPQELCSRWAKDPRWGWKRSGIEQCQYNELVLSVILGITTVMADVEQAWIERLRGYGIDIQEIENVAAFLSAKVDADRLEVLRLSLELVWFTQVIKQR